MQLIKQKSLASFVKSKISGYLTIEKDIFAKITIEVMDKQKNTEFFFNYNQEDFATPAELSPAVLNYIKDTLGKAEAIQLTTVEEKASVECYKEFFGDKS